MKVLGYLWQVAVNILYLLIILYVFDRSKDRNLTIIIAILGLIYVTIRSIGISVALMFTAGFANIAGSLDAIKNVCNLPVEMDDEGHKLLQERLQHRTKKTMVDSIFLSLISLICLGALFLVL